MLGILFSLMPLVGWGIGDFIASRLSKGSHPASINFVFGSITGIVTLAVCLPLGLPEFIVTNFVGFIVSSVLLSSGFIAMMLGFQRGATGVVSPIANAYAIVTLFVSALLFDALVTASLTGSVVVVVLGIALLSYEKLDPSISKSQAYASVGFALLAMTLFGTGFAVFEVVADQEWYQNAALSTITGF